MAGGKETPRQKLINLMYLVLLAMLALQVSAAIIQKFQFLNSSLEKAVGETEIRNIETVSNIKTTVENGKNVAADVKVLQQAESVRKTTSETLKYIKTLKVELIEISGGINENGYPAGAKDEETVANIMLGPGDSKKGKAYELKNKLNDYVSNMNGIMKDLNEKKQFHALALDAKEDPIFKNDQDQRTKDFAQVNFESTPVVAALAVLSEKESQLTSIESEVLNHLASKVGITKINVDRIRPVVVSQSNKVVTGTKFKGEMFMAAYHSTLKPEMTFQNNKIEVNNEGVAEIEFTANGGNYDNSGLLKKTWNGTIKYPKPSGGDSIYNVSYDYFVVKPQIDVQGESQNILYKNCGNKLNIQVPALGVDYNPSFSATGARIESRGKGKVTIIPTQPNVTVMVKNNGVLIGQKKFKVKLIPKPTLTLWKSGRVFKPNQVQGESISKLRQIKVRAIADPAFSQTNRDDAPHRVTKWEVTLVRGRNVVTSRTYNSQNKTLSEFASLARPGDRIVVEIKNVKRKNYKGETENVTIPTTVFSISLR